MPETEPMTHPEQLWHEGPNYAADAVIISRDGHIVLIERKNGDLAIPGGFIDGDENGDQAARREVHEEIDALLTEGGELVYAGKVDDPRNSEKSWIETSAYVYVVESQLPLTPNLDEINWAGWVLLENLPDTLYGSHKMLIDRALETLALRQASN